MRTTPGMHEPYWYPVYEYCQKNGLPIIVHGTNSTTRASASSRRTTRSASSWNSSSPPSCCRTATSSSAPGAKVIVCHCGGALDRFIKSDRHLAQKDLSKNLFFDTNALDINFLEAAIKQRGVSQTCFGTEVPGSGAAVRPETGRPGDDLIPIISGFSFLSEEDKMAIFHKNPLKLFPAFERASKAAAAA